MLLAVLHRHAGVACMDQDVFVNAVGGVRISEPAADLAVMLAIASSLRGRPLPKGFIAFGEVGLAGEVRPAPRGQERLREAAKLGSVAIVPKANARRQARRREFEGSPSTRWSASRRPWKWCAGWPRQWAPMNFQKILLPVLGVAWSPWPIAPTAGRAWRWRQAASWMLLHHPHDEGACRAPPTGRSAGATAP